MTAGRLDATPIQPASLVRDTASLGEPDRYLAALLAPADKAPGLLAIAAFCAEIARIPATIREPMMGEIRLQWWRDAIATGSPVKASGHPVADAVAEAIGIYHLETEPFLAIIDARAFDLTGDLHADISGLEAYMAATEGLPFALAARVMGLAELPDDVIRNAGLAYGLARALCRLPALIHNGGFPVPQSVLSEHGVNRGGLAERPFAAATVSGVEKAVESLRQRAENALAEARVIVAKRSRETSVTFLPLAMVEPYFRVQRRKEFRSVEQIASVLPLTRIWCLARARLTGMP